MSTATSPLCYLPLSCWKDGMREENLDDLHPSDV